MTTPPPSGIICNNRYGIPLLMALIAAGLAGNYFSYPVFPNVDFLFGSIFALLALQCFGLGRGILAAAMIAGYTCILWNHPYDIIIMTAEVAVVGVLMGRRKLGMVQADALFWLLIGMPLIYLFFNVVMHLGSSSTYIVMTKQAVNGIANAVVARLIFTGYALRTRSELISFREIIYNLLAFFVLCPALILLTIGSRTDFAETNLRIRTQLRQDNQRADHILETWMMNRISTVVSLAEMSATRPAKQMQFNLELAKKFDANFLRIGLADREATSVAFFPLADEMGKSTIGVNFAERPYIPILKRGLKPIFSEVVMGKVGVIKPRVLVLAPVLRHGSYDGYVFGVLELNQIREFLDRISQQNATLYTLLDKNGYVIMSNHPDQKVMAPYRRLKGTLNRLDDEISQWVPALPSNTPTLERWKKSFYVAQSSIGDTSDWKLFLEQPVVPFQKVLYANYTGKLTLLFLVFTVSLALAEFLSRRIMATIEELRQTTSELLPRLMSGAAINWPESGIQEPHALINNFRVMSESIRQHVNELESLHGSLERRVEQRTLQLKKLANEQRIILSTMPIGVCLIKNRTVCRANPAFEMILGYEPAGTQGTPTTQFYPDLETYQRMGKDGYSAIAGGGIYTTDTELKKKEGSLVWCCIAGRMINFAKPEDGSIWMIQDITDRKLMEGQLRASESHYRLLTENVADVAWKLDSEYRFTYVSPADERLRGYRADEVIGHTIFELTTEEGIASISDKIRQRQEAERHEKPNGSLTFEVQLRCRDGSLIWTEILSTPERDAAGTITGYHGITRDITARKQALLLEQQLLHAQKLESLGVLAGGIAHDFNNILMAIIGNADLAMMHIDPKSPAVENLRRIEQAAARAADLTRQMLAYSGKGKFDVGNFDLNRLLEDMQQMLEVSISKNAVLHLNLQRPLPPVEADAAQMRQIVLGLVLNASEAIEEKSGVIAITTGCTDCDRKYLKDVWPDEGISEGLYVQLEVADTGCGMDQETMAKLFDPFFSTKFTGRGLGMAAVLGIVKGHNGAIRVCSEQGKGTTFKVLLPASDRFAGWTGEEKTDGCEGSGSARLVGGEARMEMVDAKAGD